MHEIGIAKSILEAVQTEVSLHAGKCPIKVAIRIGELAAVDPEALRFCFEALTKDTQMQTLKLDIERWPACYACSDCGGEFSASQFDSRCAICGSERTRFVTGDQLELTYLEMEEHGPSNA